MVFDAHSFAVNKMNNFLDNFRTGDKVEVVATIKSVVYANKDNGYSVYTLSAEKQLLLNEDGTYTEQKIEGDIRAVGYFDLKDKQKYRLTGEIQMYKGLKQLSLTGSEYQEPTSTDGIIAFLSSGLIKGIGEKTADKLVNGYMKKGKFIEGFGEDTLEIIRDNPMVMTRIDGITKKKAEQIHDTYMKNVEYQNVMLYFQKYDITPAKIMKIYKQYKENTIPLVTENPFILAQDIHGFGFKVCDSIARKMGKDPHSPDRIQVGIIYTLQEATTEGHCYLTEEELIEKAIENLNIILPLDQAKVLLQKNPGAEKVECVIDNLTYSLPSSALQREIELVEKVKQFNKEKKIVIDPIAEDEIQKALEVLIKRFKVIEVEDNFKRCLYLKELHDTELDAALYISRVNHSEVLYVDPKLIEKYIKEYEKETGFTLEEKQKEAIHTAFKTNLCVLLGEAGTGKTTSVRALIYVLSKVYEEEDFNFILTAPTGKAAKRLTEVTGFEAKTIHRLLEFTPHEGFVYNSTNKLPYNLIVIDESSMLDIFLTNSLFSAIDTHNSTKVILIGDIRQLQSVGAGNVLKDISENRKIKTVKLNVIKRQAEGSGIITNAHKIVNGEELVPSKDKNDFMIVYEDDKNIVADKIVKSFDRLLNSDKYNYTLDDVQIICPQRSSPMGTDALNKRIQEVINPPAPDKKEIKRGDTVFRVGDKVIHLNNDYNKKHYERLGEEYKIKPNKAGVFNGETGIIIDVTEIYDEEAEERVEMLAVAYDDFIIMYSKADLISIDLCFALTIHKSQGSQWPVILLPIHYSNFIMLCNNLFYTAVTRAEKIACLFGQDKAMKRAIKNIVINKRNTRLSALI